MAKGLSENPVQPFRVRHACLQEKRERIFFFFFQGVSARTLNVSTVSEVRFMAVIQA